MEPRAPRQRCQAKDRQRFPQTSEIKNVLTKQTIWQTSKFYPLNIFSGLLLCNFIDNNIIQQGKNLMFQTKLKESRYHLLPMFLLANI